LSPAISPSPLYGGTTTWDTANSEQGRACPAGTVAIGLHGARGWSFDRLGLTCAPATVAAAGGSYDVALGEAQLLDESGGSEGTPFDARCPPGQALTGAQLWTGSGDHGASVYGLALVCRDLAIEATPSGGYAVTAGASTTSARYADPGDHVVTTQATFACPSAQIVSELTLDYGAWPTDSHLVTVNGIRFGCTTAAVPVYVAP
jgi:hypothetical protein